MKILKMIKNILIIVFILFFTACTQKITIKQLVPSKLNNHNIKHISLKKFNNDTIALGHNIKSKIYNLSFNGKKYFTLVNRDITKTILEEQKLQDSGIVNTNHSIGALEDVRAIISGEIIATNHSQHYYYKKVRKYDKCLQYNKSNKCIKYYTYKKRCQNNIYDIDAVININKISDAKNIYQRNFSQHKELDTCNSNGHIANKYKVFKNMSNNIATIFLNDIAPTYKFYSIEVMEDTDIDYSSKNKDLFKKALKAFKNNNFIQANSLLKKLVHATKHKSYTALYNLALSYEALNNLENALLYYTKANNINKNKVIQKAIKRINIAKTNKVLANQQINN
jgi:tetratricopeptide (TPR) repeat protein